MTALGDFVTANGMVGRVHKVHPLGCPESDYWLSIQQLLGEKPMQYKDDVWISFLVHGGGAITVPDNSKFVLPLEPFPLENSWADVYFKD